MTINKYCTCGTVMEVECSPNVAPDVEAAWDKFHTGPGHALTDKESAILADTRRHEPDLLPDDY